MLRILVVCLLACRVCALRLPQQLELLTVKGECDIKRHVMVTLVRLNRTTNNRALRMDRMKGPGEVECRIALLVPTLGSEKTARNVQRLIASIEKTKTSTCEIGMYFAYDKGDAWYEDSDYRMATQKLAESPIDMHWVVNQVPGNYVAAVNTAASKAYSDGWNFFFQVGDDVELLTDGWDAKFVSALKDLDYNGVVGPTTPKVPKHILQQSFVSKIHFCTFGFYFPPAFRNWYTDNWISNVYASLGRYRQLDEVHVANNLRNRYDIDSKMGETWKELADDGCQKLQSAMHTRIEGNSECEMAPKIESAFVEGNAKKIWIRGLGRTMSTTTQEMLNAGLPESRISLFEPCVHDVWNGQKIAATVTDYDVDMQNQCMKDVTACDFSKISNLWEAMFRRGCCNINAANLADTCLKSSYRVFKTINNLPVLASSLSLLDADPLLQMVHIERDPRSTYTSQAASFHKGKHNTFDLLNICKTAAAHMQISHTRLHKIKFHHIVTDPRAAYKTLFDKLGLPMTEGHETFIQTNFLATENCKEHGTSLCKENPDENVRKWQSFLNDEEKDAFDKDPDCQAVDQFYGYTSLLGNFPEFHGKIQFETLPLYQDQ